MLLVVEFTQGRRAMSDVLDVDGRSISSFELDILELGDAMKETKQAYPIPYTIDSSGSYGIPG
jgi:hypothetical protein